MITKELVVTASEGLHARPASLLTNVCQKFKSEIKLQKADQTVNPKSILGIMMISAQKDEEVTFIIEGEDEAEACKAIEDLFNRNFEA